MLREKWEAIPNGYDEFLTHSWDEDQSPDERRQWVQHQIEQAQKAGVELFCRETDEGCVFAFKDFDHYAAFYVNVYGDPKTDKEIIRHQHFHGDKVDPHWVQAAEMYLKQMGIDYDLKIDGNVAHFAFDRFSESAVFRMMSENGRIDEMAEGLKISEGFLGRLRRSLGMDGPEPEGPGVSL